MPSKGSKALLGPHTLVKGILNMNGRNVVGQQHDLVGVQLMVVLPYEIGIPDESGLEQLHQKRACAGERIQHVNMFIAQAPAKFMLQHMVGAG